MKPIVAVASPALLLAFAFGAFAAAADDSNELWYRQPAKVWSEALPIGNGRLGAMVFGGFPVERIQLNESSLWSGGPDDHDNPEALVALPKVRQLLFDGKYAEAEALAAQKLVCKGEGSSGGANGTFGSYQTLGDLWLSFEVPATATATVDGYRRALDLVNGVATTNFQSGDTRIQSQVRALRDAIVIDVVSTSAAFNLDVRLTRDPRSGSQPWRNDSSISPPPSDVTGKPIRSSKPAARR